MGDLPRLFIVLGFACGVRVCAQYTIACYYTEPYLVGVQLGSNLLLFCFKWSLSLDLKLFSDGASTTSEERLFNELTNL